MLNTDSIKNKEVINICDGRSLGYVCDIEINLEAGTIDGIVLPQGMSKGMFSLFGKAEEDIVIRWKDVKTIGEDVILVDLKTALD